MRTEKLTFALIRHEPFLCITETILKFHNLYIFLILHGFLPNVVLGIDLAIIVCFEANTNVTNDKKAFMVIALNMYSITIYMYSMLFKDATQVIHLLMFNGFVLKDSVVFS